MWQGVHDKQFRSCYSISNHITGWYPTHEVPPAVPILPQRAVASIIQGAKGELGSQWVKNVQVIQSLIIYQSRSNIHRSNYPRSWGQNGSATYFESHIFQWVLKTEILRQQRILFQSTFFSVHMKPLQFCNHSANRRWSQQLCLASSANLPHSASPWMVFFYLYGSCVTSVLLQKIQSLSVHSITLKFHFFSSFF